MCACVREWKGMLAVAIFFLFLKVETVKRISYFNMRIMYCRFYFIFHPLLAFQKKWQTRIWYISQKNVFNEMNVMFVCTYIKMRGCIAYCYRKYIAFGIWPWPENKYIWCWKWNNSHIISYYFETFYLLCCYNKTLRNL